MRKKNKKPAGKVRFDWKAFVRQEVESAAADIQLGMERLVDAREADVLEPHAAQVCENDAWRRMVRAQGRLLLIAKVLEPR